MMETPAPASLADSETDTPTEYGPLWQVPPLHEMLLVGAVLSTSICTPFVVDSLPAVSTACAVTVCGPSFSLADDQPKLYGALVSVPTTWPSTRKSTWSMPDASLALATSPTVPFTVVSPPGDTRATAGGVWSVSAR